MMVIDNKYELGDVVYLTTDIDQRERIVSAIVVRKTHIVYYLINGVDETNHYEFEITKHKDVLKSTTN